MSNYHGQQVFTSETHRRCRLRHAQVIPFHASHATNDVELTRRRPRPDAHDDNNRLAQTTSLALALEQRQNIILAHGTDHVAHNGARGIVEEFDADLGDS